MTAVRLRGRPRQCSDHILSTVHAMIYQEKVSYRVVCDRLNAAGVPTPGGGPTWYPSYISRLLRTRGAQEFNRAGRYCATAKELPYKDDRASAKEPEDSGRL